MTNPQPYKILIVDDIENNRFTADTMLSIIGEFDVDEADSGQAALDAMAAKDYDLVLLDIMMPGMSGLEVLDILGLNQLPDGPSVIVVSALEDLDTIGQALEKGALDYLTKPIEMTLLEARMKQLLERWHTMAELRQHRARLQADLAKAAQVQSSLCPSVPLEGKGFSIAGQVQPSLEVGGDYFDYFELADGRLVFCVGDACDKGTAAAMYASRTHDLIRLSAESLNPSDSPGTQVANMLLDVDRVLSVDNVDCWFVTLWLGLFDPLTGALAFASAGHTHPLVQRANEGQMRVLEGPLTPPLGLGAQEGAKGSEAVLEAGERLFVYSDGLFDVVDPASPEGLIELISGLEAHALPQDQTKAIITECLSREPAKGIRDDLTLLTLARA